MTNASNHCGRSLYLSRPGESNRTAFCMEPKHHAGPCQTEAVLGTFEGDVKVIMTWFPTHVRSKEMKERSQ